MKSVASRISEVIGSSRYAQKVKPDYLRDAVVDYPLRGGKRLRPALVLWTCGMLGGNTELALPAAAAVEIYHNWTLVHDDIIDNDDLRRNQKTCHRSLLDVLDGRFGCDDRKVAVDFAILAGDIQQGWANHMLLSSPGLDAELKLAISARLQQKVCCELISGEALDVEFSLRDIGSITETQVERMIYLKTAVLLRFCAECGAAIALNCGDFSDERIVRAGDFAAALGTGFQLRDDWLGIFGETAKFGKRIGADLAERKPTLMLLKAIANLNERDRAELLSLLGREHYDESDVECAHTLIRKSGAEKLVLERSRELADEAEKKLMLFPDSRYRGLLLELNDSLLRRET